MIVEYTDVTSNNKLEAVGSQKRVKLPFKHISARALIVRIRDGAILGSIHRIGGRYALPGGAVEDGESTSQAVIRELAEDNIESRWLLQKENGWYPSMREKLVFMMNRYLTDMAERSVAV